MNPFEDIHFGEDCGQNGDFVRRLPELTARAKERDNPQVARVLQTQGIHFHRERNDHNGTS